MINNIHIITILLLACNHEEVTENAQCSDAEQDMFMSCLDAGCSASYTQDLEGKDTCNVAGGGTVVSVEAGGECAFTASGSCYVICDCPDGVSLNANLQEEEVIENEPSDTNITMQLLLDRIESLEYVVQTLNTQNETCQQNILDLSEEIRGLRDDLDMYHSEVNNGISDLRNELDSFYVSNEEDISALYDMYNEQNIIVSQYDVMCYSGSSWEQDGTYSIRGEPTNPITMYSPLDSTYTSFRSHNFGCVIANVNVNDLPYHFSYSYVNDNSITYPQYSRTDSFMRYGADRPDLYHGFVNWGNDFRYQIFDTANSYPQYITSSGDVVVTENPLQMDNTIPGVTSVTDLPIRVTIIHNRSYTAP